MKQNSFLSAAIILFFSVSLSVSAQDEKKPKKNKSIPQKTVVELESETKPIVVEAPPPEQPANGSLYTEGAQNGNLLADFKARRVGDLVFVDVVEQSAASVNSNAKRSRDSGALGGIGTAAGALPVPGAAVAGTIVGALGTRKYEGKGETERNSDVRARIAARVVEVLPNGDLRVEALKLVRINKETEQLALTGIVRRSDISADNSVQTIEIGDLRVELNGKGIASKDNAPGWLFRLFEKVTPF